MRIGHHCAASGNYAAADGVHGLRGRGVPHGASGSGRPGSWDCSASSRSRLAGRAQVTSDETLGTVVTAGTVTGGTAAGTNLFHSFDQFDGDAWFEVDAAIANVIIRVTGDGPSFISAIRAEFAGTSNRSPARFFFVNPHGVAFNERIFESPDLDIDGAFFAVSASEVRFAGRSGVLGRPGGRAHRGHTERFGFRFGNRHRCGRRAAPGRFGPSDFRSFQVDPDRDRHRRFCSLSGSEMVAFGFSRWAAMSRFPGRPCSS